VCGPVDHAEKSTHFDGRVLIQINRIAFRGGQTAAAPVGGGGARSVGWAAAPGIALQPAGSDAC
jgi:hypothetical protein